MKWWSRQKFLRVLITLTRSAPCKSTTSTKVCLRWNVASTSLARTFQQRWKRPRCFLEASCKDCDVRIWIPSDSPWGWNARMLQSWKSFCRWIASLQITTRWVSSCFSQNAPSKEPSDRSDVLQGLTYQQDLATSTSLISFLRECFVIIRGPNSLKGSNFPSMKHTQMLSRLAG